jgi:hypothetical protein
MDNPLQKNFSNLTVHRPPRDLLVKIMAKIAQRQRKMAIWNFAVSGVVFVVTLVVLVPAFVAVHSAMTQSGSYQFMSLLFSNFSEVAASWQDFMFSLLESLPILGIAALLMTILFLLGSLRFINRDVKILFYRHF